MIVKYSSFKESEILGTNTFLFYGENSGRVESCVDIAINSIKKKFEKVNIVNISNEDIKNIGFYDVIANYSNQDLFGNKNILIFSMIDQRTAKEITQYINNKTLSFYLICKCNELKKNSALRSFFEKSKNGYAVACYEETEFEKNFLIKEFLLNEEIQIKENEISQLSNILSNQRQEILNELNKIVIAIKNSKKSIAESIGIVCRKNNGDIDDLVYSLASKEKQIFLVNFFNSKEIQNDLMRFVNYFSEHLFKILEVKEKIKSGDNKNLAIKSLRPPIFFKRLTEFNNQIEQWSENEILQLIKKLYFFRVSSLKGQKSSKFQLYFLFLKILG